MKTIQSYLTAMTTMLIDFKKKTDLLIIRMTNLKTYATVEAIIIGIAN